MRQARWIGLVVAWLALWPGLGWGQTSTSFTFHAGATSVTNGAVMSASNFSTIVVQIEGTFVGTVQFEKKTKGATSYVAVQCTNAADRTFSATSADAPGYWECPGGAYSFRVPVTARTSGTITVTGMGTTAVAGRGSGGSGAGGWPSSTGDKEINNADGLANAIWILGSDGDGIGFYDDPTNGPQQVAKCGGVVNDCNYYRKLENGKKFGITNSSNQVVLEWDHTGAQIIGFRDEQHFPVATCQAGVAQAIYGLPAANFPAAICDPANTNSVRAYLAFDDTTDESFFDEWIWPQGATSVDVVFRWKGAATTNAVAWSVQLVRIADGATSDPAFPAQGAGNCVSDTAKGTTLQENVATITGVTCTSCVAGDRIAVKVSRNGDGGGSCTDSFVGDAFLLTYGRIFKG